MRVIVYSIVLVLNRAHKDISNTYGIIIFSVNDAEKKFVLIFSVISNIETAVNVTVYVFYMNSVKKH